MYLDTITLQCFTSVAETGSFTRAAERIGRTQSAVSQQIAKLENWLDKPLFYRGKTLELTNAGELFQSYAKRILALHLEAIDRFSEPELEGEVRFGLPEDFATVFLADILADFSHLHPRILLHIECDLTLNLFDRFKKNEFDIVLVKMSLPQDFPNGHDVWTEKLEWVGDAQFLEEMIAHNKPIPLVLAPQPCVYRNRAITALEDAGLAWKIVFSSPSYSGTLAAVTAGLGITVLPRKMIPHNLHAIKSATLPNLSDTHISLLKQNDANAAINSLETFVFKKLMSH